MFKYSCEHQQQSKFVCRQHGHGYLAALTTDYVSAWCQNQSQKPVDGGYQQTVHDLASLSPDSLAEFLVTIPGRDIAFANVKYE